MRLPLRYKVLTFIVILGLFFQDAMAQSSQTYKVKLDRLNSIERVLYDSIVSIDFLSQKLDNGLPAIQGFAGFNYAELSLSVKENSVELHTPELRIKIDVGEFDSSAFLKNYLIDSSLFLDNLYYREYTTKLFKEHPLYPKTVVEGISLNINNVEIKLSEEEMGILYNPTITDYADTYGVNGYITDHERIILTIDCGEGAGAYIVIYIFNNKGQLETKIQEPLI